MSVPINQPGYEEASLNIGASSRRNLRKLQGQSAFLLTFSQTVKYSTDDDETTVEDVIQLPFADPISADNYVEFLKEEHPDLFGELTGASTVMTPIPFESKDVMFIEDSSSSYPAPMEDDDEPEKEMQETVPHRIEGSNTKMIISMTWKGHV